MTEDPALTAVPVPEESGVPNALITRHSFGMEGSRLASLFAPVINLGCTPSSRPSMVT